MEPASTRLARTIWRAGVAAVDAARLTCSQCELTASSLRLGQSHFPRTSHSRLIVVGAGKAGVGMWQGVLQALAPHLPPHQWSGWINVPADCVALAESFPAALSPWRERVTLHAARPAGVNEPTAEGVAGTEEILRLVASAGPDDVVLVLISGGASALLPAPLPGITLAQKLATQRALVRAGAEIAELNIVRQQLSRIKGGGLRRALQQGRGAALILSDVIGDPLELIGSGPTVPATRGPRDALAILQRRVANPTDVPTPVWHLLESLAQRDVAPLPEPPSAFDNWLIGSNQTAVEAAGQYARELGCDVHVLGTDLQGIAAVEGARWATQLIGQATHLSRPTCWIGGGETTVPFVSEATVGQGGRNQEFVLAALVAAQTDWPRGLTLLSGGTDGEDGPTDAAGGWCDQGVIARVAALGLDARRHLQQHDAYPLLQASAGLLQTGPTHTNVMDLRVAVWCPDEAP